MAVLLDQGLALPPCGVSLQEEANGVFKDGTEDKDDAADEPNVLDLDSTRFWCLVTTKSIEWRGW